MDDDRDDARRSLALERLRGLRAQVRARNQDLTDESAMEIADRYVRDVFDEMVDEGMIRFERNDGPSLNPNETPNQDVH